MRQTAENSPPGANFVRDKIAGGGAAKKRHPTTERETLCSCNLQADTSSLAGVKITRKNPRFTTHLQPGTRIQLLGKTWVSFSNEGKVLGRG